MHARMKQRCEVSNTEQLSIRISEAATKSTVSAVDATSENGRANRRTLTSPSVRRTVAHVPIRELIQTSRQRANDGDTTPLTLGLTAATSRSAQRHCVSWSTLTAVHTGREELKRTFVTAQIYTNFLSRPPAS